MTGSRSSTGVVARLVTIALILFFPLASDAPHGAAPPYTLIDLGTFNNLQSAQASDLNETSQVVGIAASRAFIWQNGAKTDLGTLAAGRARQRWASTR